MIKKILCFLVLLSCGLYVFAGEQMTVEFEYPDSFQGDFYVTGKASIPPAATPSESNITVNDAETGEETPSKIEVLERWPDGSILEFEILFSANSSRKKRYVISYGPGINRRRSFAQTSVLPVISSSVGGTPKAAESLDISVGEMIIKVDRSPDFRYYWHLAPIAILILLSFYRARRSNRQI